MLVLCHRRTQKYFFIPCILELLYAQQSLLHCDAPLAQPSGVGGGAARASAHGAAGEGWSNVIQSEFNCRAKKVEPAT